MRRLTESQRGALRALLGVDPRGSCMAAGTAPVRLHGMTLRSLVKRGLVELVDADGAPARLGTYTRARYRLTQAGVEVGLSLGVEAGQ